MIKGGLQIYHPHWEPLKFSFNTPSEAGEWKSFYFEALDINPDVEDQEKRVGIKLK